MMQPHIRLDINAGTLASMTTAQFKALQDNVLADGRWETVRSEHQPIRIVGGDYLGVYLPDIFIGIEKDGYTHS